MALLKQDYGLAEFDKASRKAGVVGSIVIQARQSRCETNRLLALSYESIRPIGVVGWIDLCADNLSKQLDAYQGVSNLKGFRHVLQNEQDDQYVLRADFIRGLKTLSRRGYRYDILIYPQQLQYVEEALQRVPELCCVIDHAAKPRIRPRGFDKEWQVAIRSIARNSNVACKISGLVTEAPPATANDVFYPYIDTLFECFGASRLMYGSDWPVCLLRRPYAGTLELLNDYLIYNKQTTDHRIWHQNAMSFYDLSVSFAASTGTTMNA